MTGFWGSLAGTSRQEWAVKGRWEWRGAQHSGGDFTRRPRFEALVEARGSSFSYSCPPFPSLSLDPSSRRSGGPVWGCLGCLRKPLVNQCFWQPRAVVGVLRDRFGSLPSCFRALWSRRGGLLSVSGPSWGWQGPSGGHLGSPQGRLGQPRNPLVQPPSRTQRSRHCRRD